MNVIILVSKFFTIGVPFVNEMNEPIPIIVIIAMSFFGFILTFLYPSKE